MKKQSFIKGSAVLFGMVAVTKGLGLVYRIPLTSMLGGSGMSCYSGAYAVFTPFFAAAAAGAPNAMSRLVSEQLALGSTKNALTIRRTALWLFMLLSFVMSAGLIFSAPALAENIIHIPQAKWAIIAVAPALIPASLMNVHRGWAEGIGSMTPTALSEIAETVCKLLFGLTGAGAVMHYAETDFAAYHGCFGKYCSDLREARLTAVPFAAAAAALGVSLASAAAFVCIGAVSGRLKAELVKERSGCDMLPPLGRRKALREILGYAAPSGLTAVIATLAGTADLITIPPCLTAAMKADPQLFAFLGTYGIAEEERAGFVYGSYAGLALTIFSLLPTFTAMLGKSVLPRLTSACARKDRAEVSRLVGSVFLLSSGISLTGGSCVMILSKKLLTLFFDGRTAEIAVTERPLVILGAAVVFMGISQPCLTALQACGRQRRAVIITLGGTAVKLILNLIMIPLPNVNICGAAAATAVSQAVICAASVTELVRGTGADRESVSKLFVPLLPSALCGCGAFLTKSMTESLPEGLISRFGAVFSVTIGLIIALISFTLLCISPKNELFYLISKKNTKKP